MRRVVLQPLRWCCVDCVIHHERDVGEEQHHTYIWREQAIIEWSWHVNSIVACCHSAKLTAYAARDFRSQQSQWSPVPVITCTTAVTMTTVCRCCAQWFSYQKPLACILDAFLFLFITSPFYLLCPQFLNLKSSCGSEILEKTQICFQRVII